jgi:mannose-6-phosphate isomerase-like protein (cupin superfamily)
LEAKEMARCSDTTPCSDHLKDHGAEPLIIDLGRITKANPNYRTALWTGTHLQVTLMSIPAGGDIGLEVHPELDQFIRIEHGNALVLMGTEKGRLLDQRRISQGYAVIVPAGTWHNILNTGASPLKLFSIYAPPQHPFGTIQETKQVAEAAEYSG